MCERVVLSRKSTHQEIIDICLVYLPSSKEFVTWQINKQFEHVANGTMNGHYFKDLRSALDDFDKRG